MSQIHSIEKKFSNKIHSVTELKILEEVRINTSCRETRKEAKKKLKRALQKGYASVEDRSKMTRNGETE